MDVPPDDVNALVSRFDPSNPAFIAHPYTVLNELREATPGFRNPLTGQWTITRFADVYETQIGRAHV